MHRLGSLIISAAFLTLPILGCDSGTRAPEGPPLYPVRGRLTVGGAPAAGAAIKFLPAQSTPISPAARKQPVRIPTAIVGSDGRFAVSYHANEDGAPEGTYKLLVLWLEEPAEGGFPRDRLRGKYFDDAKPVATVTVKTGENELPAIDLKP